MGPMPTHTVNLAEVHNTSVGLLQMLDESDTNVGHGVCALLLSAGRLMSSHTLSDAEEIAWIKTAMEWTGLYFAEGVKN